MIVRWEIRAPSASDTSTAPIVAPEPPVKIDSCRVLHRLCEGATSEVFLGRDDFPDRDIAIKRLRANALADTRD